MKFNQILPVISIYVVALGGCSNTTPDYSEFYKDPETVKEEDPSLNDNQIKVMSFNIRYYNNDKDTGDKSWEARTAAFIPMIGCDALYPGGAYTETPAYQHDR